MPGPINSGPNPTDYRTLSTVDWRALSVALLWGTSAVAQKFLLGIFTPAGFQCLRSLLGALTLLIVVRLLRPKFGQVLGSCWVLLLGAGLLMGVQMLTFVTALDLTYASEGALLISTAPIWTAIIVAVAGMEAMHFRSWLGIFVALGGVAMVVLGAGTSPSTMAPDRIAGDVLMIVSAILYGLYMVISRPLMQRHGTLVITAASLGFSNIVVVPLGLGQLIATPWAQLSVLHWSLLAYTAFFATLVGMLMWYRSIKQRGAARTATYQYLVPIVALGTAVVLLHEQPTTWQLAGIVITLGGLYLTHRRPTEQLPG